MNVSRRSVLRWLVGGMLTLAGSLIARATKHFLTPPISQITLAAAPVPNARLMRPGDVRYVPQARAYVLRDEQGYYAVSAVCTHLGCLVRKTDGEFRCPCHGSRFSLEGTNEAGPAPRPLAHLALRWDASKTLIVDPGRKVAPDTRV